jgi:hypothetical protein
VGCLRPTPVHSAGDSEGNDESAADDPSAPLLLDARESVYGALAGKNGLEHRGAVITVAVAAKEREF